MKKQFMLIVGLAALIIWSSSILAKNDAEKSFETLQSLVGEWQGKTPEGKTVTLSYEVVSNGSVLMERLRMDQEPEMVTLYHLNNDKLMLTHYCSAKNQPRMDAKQIDLASNKFQFELFDITNLANPADGHMQGLTLSIQDEDHLKQGWTWRQNNQDKISEFVFERIK